jgi:hypothetical protein
MLFCESGRPNGGGWEVCIVEFEFGGEPRRSLRPMSNCGFGLEEFWGPRLCRWYCLLK